MTLYMAQESLQGLHKGMVAAYIADKAFPRNRLMMSVIGGIGALVGGR